MSTRTTVGISGIVRRRQGNSIKTSTTSPCLAIKHLLLKRRAGCTSVHYHSFACYTVAVCIQAWAEQDSSLKPSIDH
jgi:hypothetical protein